MEIDIKKGEKNTFIANVKLTVLEVTERLDEAVKHEAEHVKVKGFRAGKAPIDMVKQEIDFPHLRGHVLNHLVPEIFTKIVKENKINPIINPRVEIIVFEENQPAEIKITLVEKPDIKIKDYKKGIEQKVNAKLKQATDKDADIATKTDKDKEIGLLNDEIIEAIVENSTVELPDLLIEEEANRMISSLVDQIAKMGVGLEQYLQSIKKTAEEVRTDYLKIAAHTLHADFAITQIAIDNNYKVEDEEISATIAAVPDEKSREELSKPEQTMYIRAILTKAKTLAKLSEYATECYNKSNKVDSKSKE